MKLSKEFLDDFITSHKKIIDIIVGYDPNNMFEFKKKLISELDIILGIAQIINDKELVKLYTALNNEIKDKTVFKETLLDKLIKLSEKIIELSQNNKLDSDIINTLIFDNSDILNLTDINDNTNEK
jgi:hypothetical protein